MASETVLITGASSGIGLELARLFAADGSDLVLVARNREKLETLAQDLQKTHGVKTTLCVQDLAEPTAPEAICVELSRQGIGVDVLVNNAGFGGLGSFARLSLERHTEMIQVNVMALVRLTRMLLPAMLERGRGGVLNVASTAAFQPGPGQIIYFATKAFVLSFTEGLAEELSGTGVQVTCLAPGPTATGFGAISGMDRTLMFRMGTMDAATVAKAGHRALRRGKVLVIPGVLNKALAFSVRFSPRMAVRKILKWTQMPKGQS